MPEQRQALLGRLSEYLAEHIGLSFAPRQRGALEAAMCSAARELGHPDLESCIRALLASRLSRPEVEILASHLTVGETYFFREKEALAALETEILPELLRSRSGAERRLRLWSAGCCTGEEAYSMAIVVAKCIPDPAPWKISILATDINPHYLRKAASGLYGAWSFRGLPAALKAQFFEKVPGGRWRLAERIRSMVSFSYLNLAQDSYPSLESGTNAMDVIFCRNVLMYFEPARARATLEKLGRCLLPGGRLFVNPVEVSPSAIPGLEVSKLAGAFGYRKTHGMRAGPASPALPIPPAATPVAPRLPARQTGDAASLVLQARACADQGRLAEALACCEQALEQDKVDARSHYLRAMILQELGESEQCGAALARALYLDPHCALAHFALGNLRRRQGRGEESLRHFLNALSVLSGYQDGEVLPETEGLTAGRLAEIIELSISSGSAA